MKETIYILGMSFISLYKEITIEALNTKDRERDAPRAHDIIDLRILGVWE